jgi:hypothetical protein
MTKRRFAMAAGLTAAAVLVLAAITSSSAAPAHPGTETASCSGVPVVEAAGLNSQCIPCSPNKPCRNPLTVCTYKGTGSHGCCLGYAGLH